MATLTGACVVALGSACAGLVSNDDRLAAKLSAAGDASGDPVWRLPLKDRYREQIKSTYADIRNSAGREAGALTAAAFLERFVAGTPWAHLDIAGHRVDRLLEGGPLARRHGLRRARRHPLPAGLVRMLQARGVVPGRASATGPAPRRGVSTCRRPALVARSGPDPAGHPDGLAGRAAVPRPARGRPGPPPPADPAAAQSRPRRARERVRAEAHDQADLPRGPGDRVHGQRRSRREPRDDAVPEDPDRAGVQGLVPAPRPRDRGGHAARRGHVPPARGRGRPTSWSTTTRATVPRVRA